MRHIIWPYRMSSVSGKLLAQELKALRVYPDRNYVYREGDLVVNWGNGSYPEWHSDDVKYVNDPSSVRNSVNKLRSFKLFTKSGVSCPDWTTSQEEASSWLEASSVVCRTLLSAHSGKGITIIEKGLRDVPRAVDEVEVKLYTKYIPKDKEFRVHVFMGGVIDVQQKKMRSGVEANPLVRNFSNGWIYARKNLLEPNNLREESIKAVNSLSLDFGAVDLMWDSKNDKCFILEVNTAPGITGATIQTYSRAINDYI